MMHRLKYILGLLLFLFNFSVLGQSSKQIDEIVEKIYNLDFENVESSLERLKLTDPQISGYLKFDCLWWKMIFSNSEATESEFVNYKNGYHEEELSGKKDFNKLIFFLYQIRYENFKNIGLSRYWTALKCQVFIQKLNDSDTSNFSPLEKIIFQLIVEFNKCLKYSIIDEFNLLQTKNQKKLYSSLEKIERIENENYRSFSTIKDYFLGKIYLEVAHDSVKAYSKFSKLSEEFPDNGVIKELKYSCRSKQSIIIL